MHSERVADDWNTKMTTNAGFFSRLDNQTVDDAIASWVLNFVFRFQTLFLLTKFMNRNEIARGQRAEWLSITVKLSQFFSRLIDQHCKIIYKWKLCMENKWVHQQGKNVNKNIYISNKQFWVLRNDTILTNGKIQNWTHWLKFEVFIESIKQLQLLQAKNKTMMF